MALISILVLVAGAAWMLTGLIRRYALAHLIDVPNERSSHRVPTPRGGGLAVILAFGGGCLAGYATGALSARDLAVLATALLVAGVGFWDDHGHVPARLRLTVHAIAAGTALALLGGFTAWPLGACIVPLGWFGTSLALLWLLWALNLFNFMDGIDGIASTEAIFVALAAVVLMLLKPGEAGVAGYALVLLAAATTGFLCWNWPPARIFMGDVGSGFIGYSLALIALLDMNHADGGLGLPVWLILNGVFLVDATYTLVYRVATGQRWYEPHRSHAYQKAARLLGAHRPVVLYTLSFNGLWLFPCALAAMLWPYLAIAIMAVALTPLLLAAIHLKAGVP